MHKGSTMREKILDRQALSKLIEDRRQKGLPPRRIVFTNGCFDLLHVGHVRYLWEARRQGDCLVVAINTDESIRRLKGPDRPILPLDERLQIMAGLACVDYVTWFEEDTPIALLELLRPEVLVKGANYPIEGVVGHELVQQWGGEVRVLHLTEGASTTNLIERVQAIRKQKG